MSRALAGGILGDFYFLPQAFVKYMDVFFVKNIFTKSMYMISVMNTAVCYVQNLLRG